MTVIVAAAATVTTDAAAVKTMPRMTVLASWPASIFNGFPSAATAVAPAAAAAAAVAVAVAAAVAAAATLLAAAFSFCIFVNNHTIVVFFIRLECESPLRKLSRLLPFPKTMHVACLPGAALTTHRAALTALTC